VVIIIVYFYIFFLLHVEVSAATTKKLKVYVNYFG